MLQDQSHNLSLLRLGSMGHNAVDETHGEMIENAAIPPNQAKLLTLLGTCQNQTSANYLNKPQIQRNSEADCTYSIPPFFYPAQPRLNQGQSRRLVRASLAFSSIGKRGFTKLSDLQRQSGFQCV